MYNIGGIKKLDNDTLKLYSSLDFAAGGSLSYPASEELTGL
jgi:hypothetical protein